jgi:hypothetical protein
MNKNSQFIERADALMISLIDKSKTIKDVALIFINDYQNILY